MPTIKQRTTMVANGSANPLVGSQYEYLPYPAKVEFAILVDTGGSVAATVFSGSDVLLQNTPIDELAVATPIQYPYQVVVSDIAAQGERLGVELRETAGGTPIVRTQVWITPL